MKTESPEITKTRTISKYVKQQNEEREGNSPQALNAATEIPSSAQDWRLTYKDNQRLKEQWSCDKI